jgi:uncharacterized beta-barrel protein YwiB (DUF1934 family)
MKDAGKFEKQDRNVLISIRGDQNFDDTGADSTELVTEGRLCARPYGYDLMYNESELTGMEGTKTTFQVRKKGADEGKVVLLRSGQVNSQMIFETGRKHYSLYETPYGTMTVDISTSRVDTDIGDSGGNIEIDYAIEIEHRVTGESRFRINVRALPQ